MFFPTYSRREIQLQISISGQSLRSMIWREPESQATAVLIRLPGEHLTRGGAEEGEERTLSGPEALRKRLLESAGGFRVVELDYKELSVPGQRLRDRLKALCL